MRLAPDTATRIDHGLAALRLAQLSNPHADQGEEEIPSPGEVSLTVLAEFCGVSIGTIHEFERTALRKVARGLRELGLPPHLARLTCAFMDDPLQLDLFDNPRG